MHLLFYSFINPEVLVVGEYELYPARLFDSSARKAWPAPNPAGTRET